MRFFCSRVASMAQNDDERRVAQNATYLNLSSGNPEIITKKYF
jgi:hypothetical protein